MVRIRASPDARQATEHGSEWKDWLIGRPIPRDGRTVTRKTRAVMFDTNPREKGLLCGGAEVLRENGERGRVSEFADNVLVGEHAVEGQGGVEGEGALPFDGY